MATMIGTLAAMLSLDATGFDSGALAAQRSIKKVEDSLTAAGERATSFTSTFVGMFTSLARGAISIGDVSSALFDMSNKAKEADRLGLATGALQGLEFAAKKAGIGNEEFAASMSKMEVTLGKATQGSAEATAVFARLGLSVATLANESPEQALKQIADKISALPTEAERAASAAQIFGKSVGVEMAAMMSKGSAGIDEMVGKAKSLGKVMSDADAAKVREATGAIKEMKEGFEALTTQIAKSAAPAIKGVAKLLNDFTDGLKSLNSEQVTAAVKAVAIGAAFGGTLMVLPKVVSGFMSVVNALKAVTMAETIAEAMSGPAGWAALAVGVGVAAAAAYGVSVAFDKISEAAQSATKSTDDAGKKIKETNDDLAAVVDDTAAAMQKNAASLFESTRTPLEKLQEKLRETRALFAGGFIDTELNKRAISQIVAEFEKLNAVKESARADINVGAFEQHTAAAVTAEAEGRAQQQELLDVAKQQLDAQKATNDLIQAVISNTSNLNAPPAVATL